MTIKKKNNAKEVLIRIMCFALGILLTLSAILVKERFIDDVNIATEGATAEATEEREEADKVEEPVATPVVAEAEEEYENQLDNENTIGDSHVEVSELVKYEEEADQKLQELKEQPVLEPDDSVNSTTRKICNIEGKKSKLNWKPFYAAANISAMSTLQLKEAERSSYEETLAINAFDKKVIENNTVSFDGVKIAIMGDSLSAGSNLSEEDSKTYCWPQLMADILGCEIDNRSVGGSSVSSCATTDPMVKRWSQLPEDADIVIVFGGTNDCLFETRDQFGVLDYDYRMNSDTFCGDLDKMLSGMKWKYHDQIADRYVRLIYVNPPSTILNDGVVAVDPEKYVSQQEYADAIKEIAPNYGFDLIDLYNTNFLNSHDYKINSEFMLDGVHGNIAAYQIMAEHMASEIIQMIEQ